MSEEWSNQAALEAALREIEAHVAAGGWDQPTRLFALVPTADLLDHEPSLVDELARGQDSPLLTSIEQADLPDHEDLTELLTQISWPGSTGPRTNL